MNTLSLPVFLLSNSSLVYHNTRKYFPNLYAVDPVYLQKGCSGNTLKQEGVFQAHMNAWKKIREVNSSKVLILEEDWQFASTPSYALSQIFKSSTLPDEYIAIGYCGQDMACTQAYLMDIKLAKKLSCFDVCMIKTKKNEVCNVDWFLSSLYGAGFFKATTVFYPNQVGLMGKGVIQQNQKKGRLMGKGVIQQNQKKGRLMGKDVIQQNQKKGRLLEEVKDRRGTITLNLTQPIKPFFHTECLYTVNKFWSCYRMNNH